VRDRVVHNNCSYGAHIIHAFIVDTDTHVQSEPTQATCSHVSHMDSRQGEKATCVLRQSVHSMEDFLHLGMYIYKEPICYCIQLFYLRK